MKVYQLIYLDYEDTETLGIYSLRDSAIKDLTLYGEKDKNGKYKNNYRILEWDTDKFHGNKYNDWDKEAFIW